VGHHLLKHEMTRHATNWGGHGPLATPMDQVDWLVSGRPTPRPGICGGFVELS